MKSVIISFILLFVFSTSIFSQENKTLKVGDKAPNFKTLADNGQIWDVNKYLGKKNIIIYFYPAAMTGGCTKQACSYRDFKSNLKSVNAVVVGISGDNVEGLKLFKKANDLNFTLLSDESGEIAKMFGVPTRDGGTITREIDGKSFELVRGTTASRWTFIVDKKGKVIYKNDSVDAVKDAEEVLSVIEKK
jgi:peroxiredoxin Q/BCP